MPRQSFYVITIFITETRRYKIQNMRNDLVVYCFWPQAFMRIKLR